MPPTDTKPFGTRRDKISEVEQIVRLPVWETALQAIRDRREWLDRLHIELTQVPAPTFRESARAAYLAERFQQLGLERVRIDSAGNLLGERGGGRSRRVALSAHLDTVAPVGMAIEVKQNKGVWHAPGISDNGAGLAALLATAAALQDSGVQTDLSLLFVANVGEEGEGDLYGMRHLFAQREISRRLEGVLVLDGSGVDRITVAGLGSRRVLVEVTGPGGHSWSDFGRVNPIVALATAIEQLRQLRLPSEPRTSLNVGMIQGGTTVNSIPPSAWMKVDMRSASGEEVEKLSQALEAAVRAGIEQEMSRGSGTLEARMVPLGDRPSGELPPSARILQVIQETDQYLGIRSRLERSSTDANIPLSLGIEAITIGGGGCGGDTHTLKEWYDPQGRELGLKRILLATLSLAGVVAEP